MGTMRTRFSPTALLLSLLFIQISILAQSPERVAEAIDRIRVDSDLVDLKVSVIGRSKEAHQQPLQQQDFIVLEDGDPQEIAFFESADAPFDLVLLLDLSGSAEGKLNLIRRSAKRFVAASRPVDRIGVVTFTNIPRVVSPLTTDRQQLKRSIERIEKPEGGTNVWDSLQFVLDTMLTGSSGFGRRAVILMSDGVDNALPDVYGEGSKTSFAELLNQVRRSDALVFPVYLDTEPEEVRRRRTPRSAYEIARQQLNELAEASGTLRYSAAKLKDLDRVYVQVIQDLSRIYSIGYRPSNSAKDGKWRSVTVAIPDRRDLWPRAKSGYFAGTSPQSINQ